MRQWRINFHSLYLHLTTGAWELLYQPFILSAPLTLAGLVGFVCLFWYPFSITLGLNIRTLLG